MGINFFNINKSFDGIDIFTNISGKIHDHEKVGIIGVNGVGKTTLVNILMGLIDYDKEEDSYIDYQPKELVFSYMKQNNNFNDEDYVLDILNSISNKLNSESNTNNYLKKLKSSLIDIGFKESDLNKKYKHLSGGEKTRLSLSIALIKDPDILFLDEPTNNLDVDAISWLENFIKHINKTVVIISHDRYFLDKAVTKILELSENQLKEYTGNYSNYKLQKENELKHLITKRAKEEKELKQLKKNAKQKINWFNKANKADKTRSEFSQSGVMKQTSNKHHRSFNAINNKIKRLSNSRTVLPKEEYSALFELFNKRLNNDSLPKYLVKVNRLKKSYNDKVIFDNANLTILRGDKIALLGCNGVGKTTFINMLMNNISKDSGTLMVNPSLKIGYYSQEIDELYLDNSVQEEIMSTGMNKAETNNLLACFLFKVDSYKKNIRNLSMGERSRLSFCKLLAKGCNFLVLDEPTNHLDIISREAIEKTLMDYDGTILFVSHDRYFTKSIANKVISIENKNFKIYNGDYSYYLEKVKIDDEKKRVGEHYNTIKDNIIKLECKIAELASKLNKKHLEEEKQTKYLEEYFRINKELKGYKDLL